MRFEENLKEYLNVLKMTRKPDRDEFTTTTKVALVVMFIVGFIGFLIYLLIQVLPGAFK
ncbi:protein translocase SEC61 complex subunit gamma [Candidatus Bathyarchaeota archaeon]|nr:MAG: protein translocase SEC61 complex subunit gamma [Candidatus Bathyarchaeota archaeon]